MNGCRKRTGALIALMFAAVAAPVTTAAQQQKTWETVWHEVMSTDEPDDESMDEAFGMLEQMADDPIDINRATREDLEQLPFLSQQQVADILEYRERYERFRSMGELRMVASLDYAQLQLLPYFIYIQAEKELATEALPRPSAVAQHARHELEASLRVPFYRRKGDDDGYRGYPYRHELRYQMAYGERVRLGIVGSQDAGEPFFVAPNRMGYDSYSYYLQLKRMGMVENMVLGKYKLSMGKGLVMGGSLIMGKAVELQRMGSTATALRPHATRADADYLQGVAATLRLAPHVRLTPFVSHRAYDATLSPDGSATTLVTSGYHRTDTEIGKKHNTHATDIGARAEMKTERLRLALNVAHTRLDRLLQPNTAVLYRRYQAQGRSFTNMSADYGLTFSGLYLSGETAIDGHGHLATLNSLSLRPSGRWGLVAVQRFYSYRYESLRAHAMSEGGHVQNESGLLVGTLWRPLPHWQLQAYADYTYFPWARYQASQSSNALDLLVGSVVDVGDWTFSARYRRRWREKDSATGAALVGQTTHRARLVAAFAPKHSAWTATTKCDLARAVTDGASNGFMLSQTVGWQKADWLLSAVAAWFRSDDHASRLYLYERQLPHQFGFASYYGRGVRLSVLARLSLGRWLCHVRLGHTHYSDRESVGTGLQQVSHPFLTDLDLQLRYRLP